MGKASVLHWYIRDGEQLMYHIQANHEVTDRVSVLEDVLTGIHL